MGVDGMLTALDSGQVDIAKLFNRRWGQKILIKYLRTEPINTHLHHGSS